MNNGGDPVHCRHEDLRDEIRRLEDELAATKAKLSKAHLNPLPQPDFFSAHSTTHFLLLLSDSALPLGSFAFSSGLESYLAHARLLPHQHVQQSSASSFSTFLNRSLTSYASTTLPFLLAAHRNPSRLIDLDDQLDATIMCTVGRRASIAQGKALLSIWDRSFSMALAPGQALDEDTRNLLRRFAQELKASASSGKLENGNGRHEKTSLSGPFGISGHLAPLFGTVASVMGLSLRQTAYVFVLSHVKALLSAAVRASMFGPYQAQKVLAGQGVQEAIAKTIDMAWSTDVEDVGQSVPMLDLWIGRHEMLYSRIFNS